MKVIRVYETVLQSILSDIFSLGSMSAMWFLNHKFCGGTWFVDLTICLMIAIFITGINTKRFSVKSAVEFLQSEEARRYINEGVKTHHATAQACKPEKDAASTH